MIRGKIHLNTYKLNSNTHTVVALDAIELSLKYTVDIWTLFQYLPMFYKLKELRQKMSYVNHAIYGRDTDLCLFI